MREPKAVEKTPEDRAEGNSTIQQLGVQWCLP
jgi:hypothetical protein